VDFRISQLMLRPVRAFAGLFAPTRAAEQVEDDVPALGGIGDGPFDEFDGFHGGVQIVDPRLVHEPDVALVAVAGIGIGLAGLAGVLLAPIYSIHPAMGQEIITPAFVVVVIGGLGSFWGVVVAALLVGFVKGATIGLGYPQFSTAVIYLMMLLVLLFRPRGLFGERIQRFE
jgi:hypothetical protein